MPPQASRAGAVAAAAVEQQEREGERAREERCRISPTWPPLWRAGTHTTEPLFTILSTLIHVFKVKIGDDSRVRCPLRGRRRQWWAAVAGETLHARSATVIVTPPILERDRRVYDTHNPSRRSPPFAA